MLSVSVIIPSYNSATTIERCIQSVLDSGFNDLEILVVDDASTDGSPLIVETLAAQNSGIVKLFRQPENGGPAKARNAGAAAAAGKYLFFLDSDTEMLSGALQIFTDRILVADAVVGVYAAEPINPGSVPLYKALLNNYFFSRSGVIDYEVFDSSRAGIRADIFRKVGGFNESLGWGMDYENEELGYRLCEKHRLVLDPNISVRHVFPGLMQLTKTYFLRVALWAEIFLRRRKFESGGVTSAETGISSALLLVSLIFAMASLLPLPDPWAGGILGVAGLSFLGYVYGYFGFLRFVAKEKPGFIPMALFLNIYFTLVIALGAGYGIFRTITSQSEARL